MPRRFVRGRSGRIASAAAPATLFALLFFLPFAACSIGGDRPPNILVVMWDTVRADRLGLYGFDKPTTPFLDEWAKGARVFDDCVSPANYTIASHASLFTGLYPSEHGARNGSIRLPAEHRTLAELLRENGYRTYLYSANPHISRETDFAQGFDVVEHPWSEHLAGEAFRIVKGKIRPNDRATELPAKVRSGKVGPWDIKASGELAARRALRWLKRSDRKKPYFVFLNYMEAHRPHISAEEYRRRVLTPEQVERSYVVDRSWGTLWSMAFGLEEPTEEDRLVMAGRYEAAIAELDDLLRGLLDQLDEAGDLENTVIVVTSDHGEHLGRDGNFGHQYSLHRQLLDVPLVVRYPERFAPGRDGRPVMTHDLFPTLLDLAGVEVPAEAKGKTVSLLAPLDSRERLSECPGVFLDPFPAVLRLYPDWDPTPWTREIRSLQRGDYKLIRWSDGEARLYRVDRDPDETSDIAAIDDTARARMEGELDTLVSRFATAPASSALPPELTEEQIQMLRTLGYIAEEE